jgi:thiol-disulfide isomerase/thioredoxin
MTKPLGLAAVLLISYQFVSAQTVAPPSAAAGSQSTVPAPPPAPYQRSPTVPPFHLLMADSATYLTKDNLKKHRPTLVMYFSPECDHCKHMTEFILADMKKFKDIEIVMATYQPFGEMKDFIVHYKLTEYPNIKIGRDDKFFLAPFYKIASLPFLALYDKNGDLITTFEGTRPADTVLNAFAGKKG